MNADQRYEGLSEIQHQALESQLGKWRLANIRYAEEGSRVTIAWLKARITDAEYREWLAFGTVGV